ncbi:MAG: gamma-glutamylcyclotransferase [Alphaproteobacteria bacterium]|nr:gamma-glutamylcyclotransferase [Alphaproteobacteria bacterium]
MSSSPVPISRQSLADGTIQKLARERDGDGSSVLSDDDLIASRRQLIPDDYPDDIWLFGYGSLIWNPTVEVSDKQLGRIYGYHRRYCLQTRIGRGTPELPGLILGLERGGCCTGQALKLDRSIAVGELDLLWKREMINSSYQPKIVKVHLDNGTMINAVTFVIDPKSPSYVSDMSMDEKAQVIATARGFIGTSLEYLERTRDSLIELGLRDPYLDELNRRIMALHPDADLK